MIPAETNPAPSATEMRQRVARPARTPTADWDELLAATRALIKAIAKNKPMTQNNARIVAEYLREAGWRKRAIGAATRALKFNRFLVEPLF
jgi:hypothetical protein